MRRVEHLEELRRGTAGGRDRTHADAAVPAALFGGRRPHPPQRTRHPQRRAGVCWGARAVRPPSDLGFDDGRFVLPPITEVEHVVAARTSRPDMLFDLPAVGLREQREERRRTVTERCEKVAAMVEHDDQALVWCHLNREGDMLANLI